MLRDLDVRSYSDLLNRYEEAIEKLKDWNIKIPSNSRLYRYRDSIKYFSDGHIPESPTLLMDKTFHVIDADEIADIVLVGMPPLPDANSLNKLRKLVKDAPIRGDDKNAPGRAVQFELYGHTLMKLAGRQSRIGDENKGEIDFFVGCDLIGIELQFEAKRPISANSLDKNVRAALGQLDSTKPGIIFLALDHLRFDPNKIICLEDGETGKDAVELVSKLAIDYLRSHRESIERRAAKKQSASSILAIVKIPVFVGNLHQVLMLNHMHLVHLKNAKNSQRQCFESIYSDLSKVWQSDLSAVSRV